MKKSVYFFCQILIAGGAMSHTISLTSTEAEAHLDDLKKQETTKRAYMTQLDGAML